MTTFLKQCQFQMVPHFFTADAIAFIDLALDLIADCETSNKIVIFSDSLSVLKSLDHTSSKKSPNSKNYLKSIMI